MSWKATPPLSIDSPSTVRFPPTKVFPAIPAPPPTIREPVDVLSLSVVCDILTFPPEIVPVVEILLAPVSIDPKPEVIEPSFNAPTFVSDEFTIVVPRSVDVNRLCPSNVSVLPASKAIPSFVTDAIVGVVKVLLVKVSVGALPTIVSVPVGKVRLDKVVPSPSLVYNSVKFELIFVPAPRSVSPVPSLAELPVEIVSLVIYLIQFVYVIYTL